MKNTQVRNIEIFKKYIEGKAVKDISLEYNLTRSRIHQINTYVERKLITFINQHHIKKPDGLHDKEFWLEQIDAYIKNGYMSRNQTVITDVPIEEQPITALGISIRASNCLVNLFYDYRNPDKKYFIKDLLNYTSDHLLELPNLGQVSLNEIKNALRSKGLFLKGDK